jgi:hypothetical protein
MNNKWDLANFLQDRLNIKDFNLNEIYGFLIEFEDLIGHQEEVKK